MRAQSHFQPYRIDGIRDSHHTISRQQFLKVARIALGSVAHEDLVDIDADSSDTEIMFHNGIAQEIVALLWTVAMKGGSLPHLVGSLVQGLHDRRAERLGDVTNT